MRLLQISYEPATSRAAADPDLFARFRFDGATDQGRDFYIGLGQASGPAVNEIWRYQGPSECVALNGVRGVLCPDYALLGMSAGRDDLRTGSRNIYRRLIKLIREHGYRHIVRAWNSVPDINGGYGDEERYKQFCLGRAEAFDTLGLHVPPAATAVGSAANEALRVFVLASREAPNLMENPRQISAYHYPRKYGPRSPSFSRAAIVSNAEGRQMYLSGTAAIVGHESLFDGDGSRQVSETLENIRHLVRTAGLGEPSATLRMYLRDPALGEIARQKVARFVPDPAQIVVLEADLCRRELLIEMDGILAGS